MKEFDAVVLLTDVREWVTEDLRGNGLHAGDFGYIVDAPGDGEWLTVEFFDDEGHTIGLADVRPDQVRPATERDLVPRRISA